MSIRSEPLRVVPTAGLTFDVVVDVQTAQLDEAFSYVAGGAGLCIGARVRVPFSGRVVNGWVVGSTPRNAVQGELKAIEEVLPDPPIDEKAIALAGWLRRHYACTYREALLAVTPRGEAEWLDRFRFAAQPSAVDEQAHALYERFKEKTFSAVAARRVLNARAKRMPLALIRRLLARLTQGGVLERAMEPPKAPERLGSSSLLTLVDGSKARSASQTRLSATLAAAGGSMFFDAAKDLGASAASVHRAVAAGILCVQHNLTRGPRVPGAAPGAPESLLLTPTAEQEAAIADIDRTLSAGFSITLLHGVTGSGKTLVYSRLVDRVRALGGQAIVLVPEIALTPQTAGRFVAAFGAKVAVLHSGLSSKDRAAVWQAAEQGALDVIVGARSAVFAPLPQPRLVIIDEEHEPSYKQDVAPRYDVAAVAAERMRLTGGSVILGSATPSLESYWRARNGEINYVRLTQRATMAPLPSVEILNLADQPRARRNQPLSPALAAAVESTLARGEKALLFVNRRGYAGLLLCRSCGFAPRCKRCAVSLVIHSADQAMRCHICGDAFRIPAKCPKCSSTDLRPYGFGTQRVEEEARSLFPAARVIRMDSDTTGAQGSHERLLHDFAGEGDILIGTQMIAKGLDYPTVTLVGVVAADLDLNRPDFRAAERTFALITQVAGRAGRAGPGSRVLVQTYAPDHYAVALASQHDYDTFARKELALRRELRYPPFGRLAYLLLTGVDLQGVGLQARALADSLRRSTSGVLVLGPAPDPLAKARGEYRYRIALKTDSEDALLDACAHAQSVRLDSGIRLTVVIDPR